MHYYSTKYALSIKQCWLNFKMRRIGSNTQLMQIAIFYNQIIFFCLETFRVILSYANTIIMVNMCSSIVRLQKRSSMKTHNSSSCNYISYVF